MHLSVAERADLVMKTVYNHNEHIVGNEKYSWVYLCEEDLAVAAKSLNMYAGISNDNLTCYHVDHSSNS